MYKYAIKTITECKIIILNANLRIDVTYNVVGDIFEEFSLNFRHFPFPLTMNSTWSARLKYVEN